MCKDELVCTGDHQRTQERAECGEGGQGSSIEERAGVDDSSTSEPYTSHHFSTLDNSECILGAGRKLVVSTP